MSIVLRLVFTGLAECVVMISEMCIDDTAKQTDSGRGARGVSHCMYVHG
jgi:hypothetical protein